MIKIFSLKCLVPIMVMLMAGGSFYAGSDNPHCGADLNSVPFPYR
jgi:hypothetical protein